MLYFWFSNFVTSVPMYGKISTANSSPSRKYSLGSYPNPTPAGVPVRMMVPGRSVVPCERKETIFGTEKMRSLLAVSESDPKIGEQCTCSHPQSCMTFPFFNPLNLSFAGSGTNSVDTTTGPELGQSIYLMRNESTYQLGRHHQSLCYNSTVTARTGPHDCSHRSKLYIPTHIPKPPPH